MFLLLSVDFSYKLSTFSFISSKAYKNSAYIKPFRIALHAAHGARARGEAERKREIEGDAYQSKENPLEPLGYDLIAVKVARMSRPLCPRCPSEL